MNISGKIKLIGETKEYGYFLKSPYQTLSSKVSNEHFWKN